MSTPAEMPQPIYSGKVRDTYEAGDNLLMIASDRLSLFDVVMNETVPGKGAVLTAMTEFWLRHTKVGEVAPSHLLSTDPADFPAWAKPFAGRAMLVRKADMIMIECIVRGYLVGSGWREYKEHGTLHGTKLPEGMQEGQELPEPLFTPSTKAEKGSHDENISFEQAVEIVGKDEAEEARRISLEAYRLANEFAKERGILLLDTKFELGWIDGKLSLCDEILTPDSSRFVDASTHQAGRPPVSMDKEHARQWAMSTGWAKTPPPPAVPENVIAETSKIYQNICKLLTGSAPGTDAKADK
jgi:phosphoribosylaminoimidazole-succinocarboxamide synthase